MGSESRSGNGSAAASVVLDGDVHVAIGGTRLDAHGLRGGLAFAPRQQAQLWQGDEAHQVHAVVVRPDSISAVPFTRPMVAGFWKGVGLVAATFAVLCARWCIQPDS